MNHFKCTRCKSPFSREASYYKFCSTKCSHDDKRDFFERTSTKRFWKKVGPRRKDKCWIWKAAHDGKGYGHVIVKRKSWKSYRYAWFITNGPIPKGMHVCHSCNNAPCVNPSHLYLATHKKNMKDAARDFLFVQGIRH